LCFLDGQLWPTWSNVLILASNPSSPSQSFRTPTNASSQTSFPGLDVIPRPNSALPSVDRALFYFLNYTDAPIVRWLRTHSGDPWSAGKHWVVKNFQFWHLHVQSSRSQDMLCEPCRVPGWLMGQLLDSDCTTPPRSKPTRVRTRFSYYNANIDDGGTASWHCS